MMIHRKRLLLGCVLTLPLITTPAGAQLSPPVSSSGQQDNGATAISRDAAAGQVAVPQAEIRSFEPTLIDNRPPRRGRMPVATIR